MNSFAWVFTTVALLIQTQWTHGSEIIFDQSPDVIQTILTTTMLMRCSIRDDVTTPSSGLVGRAVIDNPTDIHHVTSLVVLRNGVDVAAISNFSPAKAYADLGQLEVTGQITGSPGERAFLELKWIYPGEAQSGNYTCEVNGVVDPGHAVIRKKSLVVSMRTPTFNDIVNHVHNQEIRIQNQETIINKIINETYDKIRDVENEMKCTMQDMIDRLNSTMQSKIDQLTSALQEKEHIENGTIDCGDSSQWSLFEGKFKYNIVSQQFNTSYSKVPIVRWTISDYDFDHDSNYDSVIYHINVIETTEHNFTVKCEVRNSSGYRTNELKLHWTGFSQQ